MSPMPRFGLGFRTQHFVELARRPAGVDWLELLADNYLGVGGPRRAQLEQLRAAFPLALHGVSLGIANDAPPRSDYVAALRELADVVQPLFVSDHLCWTGIGGVSSHDLLPIATTREVLALVSERVARVQDALGRRILLENASAYVKFRGDELSEAELLAALCERTGCGVLLDVNNLYVNALNLGADPHAALGSIAPSHVGYLHIAGHTRLGELRVDTHAAPVQREVWELFAHAARRFPSAGVMLERDDHVPALAELVAELDLAREHWQRARAACTPPIAPHEITPSPAVRVRSQSRPRVAWRDTQRAFWACIAQPRSEPRADALAPALDARVPVAPQRGLRVYRDAYALMPERALAANFPTLARVLTRADFSALCAAFARAHPSTAHDYVSLGAPLAAFIECFELADHYDVDASALADIARLEQAQLESQEAPDDASQLPPRVLAELAPEQWPHARFCFSRSLRIVTTRWDVLPAVRAAAAAEKPALPKRVDTAYLVSRAGGLVHARPIDLAGARALRALAAGASFAEACEQAGGEAAARAAGAALVTASALSGITGRSGGPSRALSVGAQSPTSSSGSAGCSH